MLDEVLEGTHAHLYPAGHVQASPPPVEDVEDVDDVVEELEEEVVGQTASGIPWSAPQVPFPSQQMTVVVSAQS